ncbi:MAG: rhodanese-like domain-containing protein [Deinococcales bacterium]
MEHLTEHASEDSENIATALWHDAFYKFVRLNEPDQVVEILRELTKELLGSILVAEEGINGMLAGTSQQLDNFRQQLAQDSRFKGAFNDMIYKRSMCKTTPFHKIKVKHRPEIVPLGIENVDATCKTGINVSPQAWRELIKQEDVVLIDNRNDFEYRLGRFEGAINPRVNHFRDFPKFIEEHLPKWQQENKRIAMYCTGGIRCEKTTAWMLDLGLEVYQLEGGILHYFEKMSDADKDWHGECFVFDNRIALDTHLQETDTTVKEVYDPLADGAWRVQRAQLLNDGPENRPEKLS